MNRPRAASISVSAVNILCPACTVKNDEKCV